MALPATSDEEQARRDESRQLIQILRGQVPDGYAPPTPALGLAATRALLSETRRHALVIGRDKYYFFEDVQPRATLHPDVAPDHARDCCYGYSSSDSQSWRGRFWLSPLAFRPMDPGDSADLDAFNKWATGSRLRDDLPRLLGRGFGLSAKAKVTIVERPPNAANEAFVSVVEKMTWYNGIPHWRKLVLHFSRKECSSCKSGKSGWWLWKFEATQRCSPGYGHTDFSPEPCRQ